MSSHGGPGPLCHDSMLSALAVKGNTRSDCVGGGQASRDALIVVAQHEIS